MSPSSQLTRRFHPEASFGGFTDIDGSVSFYARVQELLPPDGHALDVGCGRGTQADDPVRVRRDLRTLRGRCGRVIGLDVDPAAAGNPFIDEFRPMIAGNPWPVENSSTDLVLIDFVLEHVADPRQFLAEAARVIRPGAVVCIRTVNVNSYVGLASRLIPRRLHVPVLRRVQPARRDGDVFPTLYRCNTLRSLRRMLGEAGFDAVVYGAEAEPAYLGFSSATYALGLLHRRISPNALRVGLIGWGRRR